MVDEDLLDLIQRIEDEREMEGIKQIVKKQKATSKPRRIVQKPPMFDEPVKEMGEIYNNALDVCPWCKQQPAMERHGKSFEIYCANDHCQVQPAIKVNSQIGSMIEWNYKTDEAETVVLKSACDL